MKKFAPQPAAAQDRVRSFSFAPRAPDAHSRTTNSRFASRAARIFVSCFAVASAFLVAASAAAQTQTPPRNESERELFELLNNERVAHNLPELKWDDALFKAARQHALLMLDLNIMEHQLPGEPGLEERITAAGARFTYIAENIAIGKDSATIHNAWMHSPGHRANILSPRATSVGIAVVRGTAGLFAVQDFSQSFADESLEQQEKQVASLLTAKGLRVAGTAEDADSVTLARKACDKDVGYLGTRSRAVIRFETGDLSTLDPEVEKKIRADGYHNVAVGACRTREAAGFSRYKIALLFF
jgi:uncharacterized protein YkwD